MSHKNYRAINTSRDGNFYGEFYMAKKTIKNKHMKSILLRSFSIAAIALLIAQEMQAQRYHGRYRYYGYGPYRGQRVVHIAGPRFIIPYGGISFHYSNGYFYRPYGGYFRVVAPPIGININILPRGYRRVFVGGDPYYYYGGTYYRPGSRPDEYEVVDAPLGASVPELPNGAKVVVINDQKYYELDGTYYKEEIRDNDEIWYTVVGKDGKINTDEEYTDDGPVIGDIVDKLPDDCRTVTLNGNKYYVSPDDVYYEETAGPNNTIRYKVVGK